MPEQTKQEATSGREITTQELLGWLEFSCWTAVILIPILYFINGPAVSFDQFVVRTALTIVALFGALALTGRRMLLPKFSQRRRQQAAANRQTSD